MSTAPSPAPARPTTPRARVVAIGAAALLVVAAGVLYLVGYLLAGDHLPRKAVVSGVALGGLSRAEAVTKLTTELDARAATPLALTAGDAQVELPPGRAGLSVDVAASVEAAGAGRSADPRHIVRVLVGGGPTEAVVVTEEAALEKAVAGAAADLDRDAVPAGLSYAGTSVTQTRARTGIAVRQQEATTAVRRAFLGSGPVALPVDVTQPAVTDQAAAKVLAELARPAVSGPVEVTVNGSGSFSVSAKMIARSLTFVPKDGTLVADLDADTLRTAAADAVDEVASGKARDATVRISDGRPRVVPARDGTRVTADALAEAVRPVLARTGGARTAKLELSGARADFTTADAQALGVKQVTGRFTTYFPYATYRNVNIGRAAELIDNTLLKPGDTFSLNKVVGERTRANGFTEGFIISGNKFKKELGGGVSQSATTTFNAMFFAGLKDVEHQPHSLYINRYPAGREATVAWPSLDLRFTNDTRYGVLVQASVKKATPSSRGSITVTMWSTKSYDSITSSALERSNFTSGTDLTDDSSDCEPQEPAQGFDVRYQRLFANDGQVVKRESFRWRYAPTNKITCR